MRNLESIGDPSIYFSGLWEEKLVPGGTLSRSKDPETQPISVGSVKDAFTPMFG